MRVLSIAIVISILFISCSQQGGKQKEKKKPAQKESVQKNTDWAGIIPSLVRVESFDNNRILETGQGFFVAESLVVTKYSLVSKANKTFITPYNESKKYPANNFVAIDRINDLIILKADGIKRQPISLFTKIVPRSAKSLYISRPTGKTIPLRIGKVLSFSTVNGVNLYRVTNKIRTKSFGTPVFVSNKKAIGIAFSEVVDYEMQSFVIPANLIAGMLNKKQNEPQSLESLRTISNKKVGAENSKIKGLCIETERGAITIRLFNETAEYRDNFIKLVKEGYYDSLLIHRVIKGFGIQSGAADTRYATKGDVIGWKGPGYTIPAHIVTKYFHKRGMVGSPRKPDRKNALRRSDGSQFYIVSGRRYSDSELDDIEKENNYKFSEQQRQAYKTVGGAPHLDGTYTVFGEVLTGMDVVDSISNVKTGKFFRPVKDIRIKRITIVK